MTMTLREMRQKAAKAYRNQTREYFYERAIGRTQKDDLDNLFAGNVADKNEGLKLLILCLLTMQFESMVGNQEEGDHVTDEALIAMAEETYQEMENA